MKHLQTFESFDYINEGFDVSSLLQKLGTIKDKVYNEIKSKGYLEKLQTVLAPFKDCKSVEEVQAKAKELAPDASIFAYGNFITVLINFILLAFVVFLLIKGINKMKKEEVAAPEAPAGPSQEELLAEIRDLLKNK